MADIPELSEEGSPWHQVAAKFLQGGADHPDICAHWESRQDLWTFHEAHVGEEYEAADPKVVGQFKEISRAAIGLLGQLGGPPAQHAWLDFMRKEKRGFRRTWQMRSWGGGKASEAFMESGVIPPDWILTNNGTIAHVFRESAEFCEDLAARARREPEKSAEEGLHKANQAGTAEPSGDESTSAEPASALTSTGHTVEKAGISVQPESSAPDRQKLNLGVIGKFIEDEGYKNDDLAVKLGISSRAVSSLRNDGGYHGSEALTKLANLMKCEVDDLLLP